MNFGKHFITKKPFKSLTFSTIYFFKSTKIFQKCYYEHKINKPSLNFKPLEKHYFLNNNKKTKFGF